ncbi:hypothetical protein [Rubrobacter radiotolerans]|uniref:Uncharacterized protein n=1 Tax=Rubrobacter radiotolerans TaxID=42256 RepID=A0AB35T262_RUBRA|nr:hypothetical protein [Rubrobacter radiotolerans]MDX5893934.1 hypothetical protein [Rubrobacter radiotolerans]
MSKSRGHQDLLRPLCPACESRPLTPCARLAMRCAGCGRTFGGPLLRTLLDVVGLPEFSGDKGRRSLPDARGGSRGRDQDRRMR